MFGQEIIIGMYNGKAIGDDLCHRIKLSITIYQMRMEAGPRKSLYYQTLLLIPGLRATPNGTSLLVSREHVSNPPVNARKNASCMPGALARFDGCCRI